MITITLAQSFFYSIALAILWLTPGPVWVAVLARSISGGFQSSVPLVLGVALGDLLWPMVALMGVSYLILIYADILTIFRFLASIILVLMGLVLDYPEDSNAETDMNVVMTEQGKFIEIQGTAEEAPFSQQELSSMLALAESGISELIELQKAALTN